MRPSLDGCYWKTFDYQGDGWDVFSSLSAQPFVFFLDSFVHSADLGRYSFIGYDPFHVYRSSETGSLNELEEQWRKYKGLIPSAPWPFASGLVGYIAYDHALDLNKARSDKEPLNYPQVLFGLYDLVIIIDHELHEVTFFSSGLPLTENIKRKKRAQERVENAVEIWKAQQYAFCGRNEEPQGEYSRIDIKFDKNEYCRIVEKAKEYIRDGDIYQVNLAQRFVLKRAEEMDPIDLYSHLRKSSGSCFSLYFNAGEFQVLSGSLERFLKVNGGFIETRPMKGTRPRGNNAGLDFFLRNELEESLKEQAELLMITDLMRNDLGKVCEFGSVKVEALRTIEEYPTVFQATSSIRGKLLKDLSPFDVLAATFPPGSVTGCPKIRALSVIEELENFRRGIYCGAGGYIGFDGNMDMNVMIRTLLLDTERITFFTGSGIVADSVPEQEFEEVKVKAMAMINALKSAMNGGDS
jgi:para-aminobenzoate synthetase component 1